MKQQTGKEITSHDVVRAMAAKYLRDFDDLATKGKWTNDDHARFRELREVLRTVKQVKEGQC